MHKIIISFLWFLFRYFYILLYYSFWIFLNQTCHIEETLFRSNMHWGIDRLNGNIAVCFVVSYFHILIFFGIWKYLHLIWIVFFYLSVSYFYFLIFIQIYSFCLICLLWKIQSIYLVCTWLVFFFYNFKGNFQKIISKYCLEKYLWDSVSMRCFPNHCARTNVVEPNMKKLNELQSKSKTDSN